MQPQRQPAFRAEALRGAGQRAGLRETAAHEPSTRIQQTYLRNAAAIAAAGLGDDWESYRRGLLDVRRAGFAVSHGQITLSVTGVAVPIFAGPSRRLVGSLARAYAGASPPYPGEAECAQQLHTLSALVAAAYVRAAAT